MEICASGSTDRGRSAVYAAEDQWSRLLDRGGAVDFFGSTLTVAKQRTFGDLDQVRQYLTEVTALCVQAGWGCQVPQVRMRKGQTAAHYERKDQVIALPIEATWALRESVLLHELAHHLRPDANPIHGGQFRATLTETVRIVMGDESALMLQMAYRGVGLS